MGLRVTGARHVDGASQEGGRCTRALGRRSCFLFARMALEIDCMIDSSVRSLHRIAGPLRMYPARAKICSSYTPRAHPDHLSGMHEKEPDGCANMWRAHVQLDRGHAPQHR